MENAPISRLGVLYLSLGLAQAAHSIEEILTHLYDALWAITRELHRVFAFYPQFRWPVDVFAAINVVLVTLLLGSWPFVERRHSLALVVAWIAGIVEILNGINHLAASILFRRYISGVITAPFLLVLGLLLVRELIRSRSASRLTQ